MKKLISLFKKKAPEWAFLRVEKQRNGRFPETGMDFIYSMNKSYMPQGNAFCCLESMGFNLL